MNSSQRRRASGASSCSLVEPFYPVALADIRRVRQCHPADGPGRSQPCPSGLVEKLPNGAVWTSYLFTVRSATRRASIDQYDAAAIGNHETSDFKGHGIRPEHSGGKVDLGDPWHDLRITHRGTLHECHSRPRHPPRVARGGLISAPAPRPPVRSRFAGQTAAGRPEAGSKADWPYRMQPSPLYHQRPRASARPASSPGEERDPAMAIDAVSQRTRRAVLAGAVGDALASVTTAIGQVSPVRAAECDALILGQTNDATGITKRVEPTARPNRSSLPDGERMSFLSGALRRGSRSSWG